MTTPAPPVKGVHHTAFRCRDAAETRAFYEDILGLPLKAALTFEKDPGGQDRPYMHLFFALGDGNYIAFFDLPHTVEEAKFPVRDGMEEYHIAMELASMADLERMRHRLVERGVAVFGPIDHHFCHSIYFYDPNGINLEFTVRDPRHDAIMAEEAAGGPATMAAWAERMDRVRAARLAGTQGLRAQSEQTKSAIAAMAQAMIEKAGRATAKSG